MAQLKDLVVSGDARVSGNLYRKIMNPETLFVTDFAFDASLLPSEEELARIAPPKSLTDSKVYVKRK